MSTVDPSRYDYVHLPKQLCGGSVPKGVLSKNYVLFIRSFNSREEAAADQGVEEGISSKLPLIRGHLLFAQREERM